MARRRIDDEHAERNPRRTVLVHCNGDLHLDALKIHIVIFLVRVVERQGQRCRNGRTQLQLAARNSGSVDRQTTIADSVRRNSLVCCVQQLSRADVPQSGTLYLGNLVPSGLPFFFNCVC